MSSDKPALDALRIDRSIPRRASPRWIAPTILGLLGIAVFVAWFLTRTKPVSVETALVRAQTGATGSSGGKTVLNASGYVTARRSATVSSKVTGKVTEVLVE